MGFLLLSDSRSQTTAPQNQARTQVLSCPFSANGLLDAVQTLAGVPLRECEEACA